MTCPNVGAGFVSDVRAGVVVCDGGSGFERGTGFSTKPTMAYVSKTKLGIFFTRLSAVKFL